MNGSVQEMNVSENCTYVYVMVNCEYGYLMYACVLVLHVCENLMYVCDCLMCECDLAHHVYDSIQMCCKLQVHLLLHFHERVGALFQVAAHQALNRRALHAHEFVPRVGVEHGVGAVHLARLLLHALLDIHERLHVLLEEIAHHALHRVAVKTDDLPQEGNGQKRLALFAFLFEDDLRQHTAGDVFTCLAS